MRYIFEKTMAALAVTVAQLAANDIEPGKEYYDATRTPNPIVVDGSLTEWVGVPVLADPKYAVPKGSGTNGTYVLFEEYNGGSWTGPDDQTSAVQVVWDADSLYIGIVVTDDYHENSAYSPWNGDSAQLMIANSTRTTQVALYNYSLGGVEGALGDVIIQHEAGPGGTEAMIVRDSDKKKTYYEIKMPAASLGLTTLTAGTKIGLGMAINDGDELTPGQKGWGGLGAHSIVFGKSPSETALLTLSTNVPGADRLFFSAINPTPDSFTFRATDKGASIVDPTSAKLYIDSQSVTLTASPKNGDATDFTCIPSSIFLPNSEHTYKIEMKDSMGNMISVEGNFKTAQYALLAPSDKVTANTSKPGFMWNVHQNAAYMATDNTRPLYQLAGYLGVNEADPNAQGVAAGVGVVGANSNLPITFEIPTVINLEQEGGLNGSNGNIQPDEQMPGIPGTTGGIDGIVGEIITYVELPAGKTTMIVNSDDGFRTTCGRIPDIFQAQIAGEYNAGRGASDTAFTVYVQEAGTYAFRTVWEEGGGGANVEWLSVKADGTKVLLNDTANGGLTAYRAAMSKGQPAIYAAMPMPGTTGVSFDVPVRVSLQDGDAVVDTSSVKLTIDGTQVSAAPVKAGNLTTVVYQPASFWAPASQHTVGISFSANGVTRTESWSFSVANYGLLTKAHKAVSVDTSKPGFLWNVFQNESYTHNLLAQAELALIGQLTDSTGAAVTENRVDSSVLGPSLAAGVKVGPLYRFEIPTVINVSQTEGEANGYFSPDEQMPGIPGTTGSTDGIDAEILTFVELPAGVTTMGVVSDDGFRVQAGYVNKPADGVLLGEVDNSTADVTFRLVAQEAGIYPIRVIWLEGVGGAHIELYTLMADGTRVLIGDADNGGCKAYRSGVAPNKPTIFNLAASNVGGKVEITWTEPGVVLQQSTNNADWSDVSNATSPYQPVVNGTGAKFYRLRN